MKRYIIMLAVALVAVTAGAQNQKEDLHKEITLDKDFVPVEKKATKKNNLPQVAKTKQSTSKTALNFSDWAQPTEVTTEIPTLLPYGYRTAHLFSDKRGYLDVGGGSQANFTGAFGYRIIDDVNNTLRFYLQHNSTWAGRNSSMETPDYSERHKQKVNDNALRVDYTGKIAGGTLSLGALGHIDSYNYYGGWQEPVYIDPTVDHDGYYAGVNGAIDWGTLKQSYHNVALNAAWDATVNVRDHELAYNVGLQYGHAGYAEPLATAYNRGVQENALRLDLGGSYALASGSVAGLNIAGEWVKHNYPAGAWDPRDGRGMITLSPYYRFNSDRFHLQAGVNVHLSFSDGATLRLSPDVKFDMELTPGLSFFASAGGGKDLGYLDPVHTLYRYSAPLSIISSIYTPLDAEAGLAIGPFAGFSARLSAGYAIVKGALDPCLSPAWTGIGTKPATIMGYTPATGEQMMMDYGAATFFTPHDTRGCFVGVDLNYKYRSLVDAKFSLKYAPQDDTFDQESFTTAYDLGAHAGNLVINAGVDVTPIRPLTLNVGFDYVGQRGIAGGGYDYDAATGLFTATGRYAWIDMRDIVNLKAGATYRFDKSLAVWAQASNLLNKRWDIYYGMGAQRINLMAGVQVTF